MPKNNNLIYVDFWADKSSSPTEFYYYKKGGQRITITRERLKYLHSVAVKVDPVEFVTREKFIQRLYFNNKK